MIHRVRIKDPIHGHPRLHPELSHVHSPFPFILLSVHLKYGYLVAHPVGFSALRHFMVAKDSIAPEAGFEKSAPFYDEKMAHFITSKERQIDEL